MIVRPSRTVNRMVESLPSGHFAGSGMGGGSCRRGPLHEQIFQGDANHPISTISGLTLREKLAIYLTASTENASLKQEILEKRADLLQTLLTHAKETLKISVESTALISETDLFQIDQLRRTLRLIKEIAMMEIGNPTYLSPIKAVLNAIASSESYFSIDTRLILFCIKTEEKRTDKK